jgi:hypothetical protein
VTLGTIDAIVFINSIASIPSKKSYFSLADKFLTVILSPETRNHLHISTIQTYKQALCYSQRLFTLTLIFTLLNRQSGTLCVKNYTL